MTCGVVFNLHRKRRNQRTCSRKCGQGKHKMSRDPSHEKVTKSVKSIALYAIKMAKKDYPNATTKEIARIAETYLERARWL